MEDRGGMRSGPRWEPLVIGVLVVVVAYLGWEVHALRREASRPMREWMTASSFPGPSFFRWKDGTLWGMFDHADWMQREMQRMFRDAFGAGWRSWGLPHVWGPSDLRTDLRRTKDGYVLKMDVPGLEKADIHVEARGPWLRVYGERREDTGAKEGRNFFHRERRYGYFSRVLPLPEDADTSAMRAEYRRGVLTLTIPRLKEGTAATGTRKVDVL